MTRNCPSHCTSTLSVRTVARATVIVLALGALSVPRVHAIDIVSPLLAPVPVTPGEAQFKVGLAALEENDLPTAEKAFKESIKLDSGAAAPYMGLAQVALRRGEKGLAEINMKRALELEPNSASIQTTWGTFLYTQRDLRGAEAALKTAVKLDANAMAAHLHLGDLYLTSLRRTDAAITEYRAALALAPTHPGAHYALGLAYLTKGDTKQAEAELREASKLAPQNALAHHALGRVYEWQGQWDKALQAFDRAIKTFNGFAAAHYERGQVFSAKGDDARALKEYAEAQRKDPKRSVGYTNIGMVHQRNQRWKAAEDAYLAAVKIEPKNAVAFNNMAWMAAERKTNLARGLEWANKAVSLGPQVPEFQVTLAWVYRAQGDLARAEQTLLKAAALKTSKATTFYYLGRVYLERGKKAQAIGEMKKALAREPNFPESADARKTLKELGQS